MISRFFQLVLLAGLILLIPSFLYLAHPAQPTLRDPQTGLIYTSDSLLTSGDKANPLAQVSQGKGVDQTNVWNSWSWKDASVNVNNGVHKVEDQVKGLIDHWRPTGPAPASTDDHAAAAATKPKVKPPSAKKPASSTPTPQIPGKDVERVEGVIMPKMGNATAKAALGRSTWHFLHTMTLRFPDNPTKQESETLRTFFQNFALLYPCGECARHFQQLIKELPPQVGSRKAAGLWLCAVHNEVNKSLGKEEFPCDKLDESYDCGCGEDPTSATATGTSKAGEQTKGAEAPQTTRKEVTPFA